MTAAAAGVHGHREEEGDLPADGREAVKAQGFLGWDPPWGHQLRLFLCYCAVNKWLYGMRYLRLCCGKPRAELARKPGLAVDGCVGSQGGHVDHGSRMLRRGFDPAVSDSGLGMRLPGSLMNGQTGKFP